MSISSSVIISAVDQGGGRFSVSEEHTDHFGNIYPVSYIADDNVDQNVILAAHAAEIENTLAEKEFEASLVFGRSLKLQHQTIDEYNQRLCVRYKTSYGEENAKVGKLIVDRIESGELVEGKLSSAFGIKWDALKIEMTALKESYDVILSAKGEDAPAAAAADALEAAALEGDK